jgi:catechol 2,3-dioxygenase-like lactoylglutathione lyase family enzyme
MQKVIAGIQQVGIGVANVVEAFNWYKKYFGMDILVFQDEAEANLMLRYTGGKPHKRNAYLALNMASGGGFEIWQYTSRTPQPATKPIQLGDFGIFSIKIKSKDVAKSHEWYTNQGLNVLTKLQNDPAGKPHFYMADPYGNVFEIVESNYWYMDTNHLSGGVAGTTIGVANMQESLRFYKEVLGYDQVVYDTTSVTDLAGLPFTSLKGLRRILLTHSKPYQGAFTKLLGPTTVELVQNLDGNNSLIFENRYWGDLGFIHLCYDIKGMELHEAECEALGYPLTVNSKNSFDMGKAAGHFTYNEDPSGTLIEYVETHKVPILKKLGIYLNLKTRPAGKSLPDFVVKALRFSRVK